MKREDLQFLLKTLDIDEKDWNKETPEGRRRVFRPSIQKKRQFYHTDRY